MKKYNRFDHHMVLLGIVIPFLVFFITMNATFAYFTATASPNKASSETAILKVNFNSVVGEITTDTATSSTKIFPGDTLNVSGKVVNSGTTDCYIVLEFEVKITKQNSYSTETVKKEYYTYVETTESGTTTISLEQVTGTTGNYDPLAYIIPEADGNDTRDINFSYEFLGSKYDNSYKNATVTYKITANAIQTTNLTQSEATDILMDNAGYTSTKIYGNSIQNGTPSIDNPVEIQSVGDPTVNLCNMDSLLTNNILIKNDDNSYSLFRSTAGRFSNYQNISLSAGTTVTLSLTTLNYTGTHNYKVNAHFKQADGGDEYLSIVATSDYNKITLSEDIVSFRLYMQGDNPDGTELKFENMQLEIGSTPSEYEPYGKYKIPINVQGKNLFDACIDNAQYMVKTEIISSNEIKQTGTSSTTSGGYSQFKINLQADTYTLSISTIGNGSGNKRVYIWGSPNGGNLKKSLSFTDQGSITFTLDSAADYWIGVYLGCFVDEVETFRMQIEKGSTATEYAPYVGQTNIYLDEPLRRIGDVADYLDLETGEVIRRVTSNIVSLDQSQVYFSGTSWDIEGYTSIYSYALPLKSANPSGAYIQNVICDKFMSGKWEWSNFASNNLVGVVNHTCYFLIDNTLTGITSSDTDASKKSKIATWINNQNIEFVYALETPYPEKVEVPGIDFDKGYTIQSTDTSVSAIPDEYQQVEYIQSSGTDYIDTGYIPNSSTNVVYDFEFVSGNASTWTPILGQRKPTQPISQAFAFWVNSSSGLLALNYNSTDSGGITGTSCFQRNVYSNNGTKFYVNNTLVKEFSAGTFEGISTLTIFGNNQEGVVDTRNCVGKVYSLKIYENNSLVRNFIPCYRVSDNKIGLYDTITKQFYSNSATTDNLTKGADV